MPALRMTFLTASLLPFIGIALTGFSVVHWMACVPVTVLLIAAITGICPGIRIFTRLGVSGTGLSPGSALMM